jgi:hypothetical protein
LSGAAFIAVSVGFWLAAYTWALGTAGGSAGCLIGQKAVHRASDDDTFRMIVDRSQNLPRPLVKEE